MKIAASLICANPLDLNSDLKELESSNVEFIHFDVMDGNFVPRYGLYPEILSNLKQKFNLTVDVHMMVDNPEDYISTYKSAGADFYNFHIESTKHSHRILYKVKNSGMKAGIALNPGTPLSSIEPIINDIDMVVLMAINPGIVGHKFIPSTLERIKELRNLSIKNNPDLQIQIDGGVTPSTGPEMVKAGADILVCGNGTIFRRHEDTISNKINSFRKLF